MKMNPSVYIIAAALAVVAFVMFPFIGIIVLFLAALPIWKNPDKSGATEDHSSSPFSYLFGAP